MKSVYFSNKVPSKEAFVYCWTDHANDMLYIGYHKGTTDDGYICSSKIMLEEYHKRPTDFTREILAEGSHEDMYNYERTLLRAFNVKEDYSFYNRSNGAGAYKIKKHTGETKRKIGQKSLGRIKSDETKNKISKGNLGKVRSEEHKQKCRESKLKWHKNNSISGENNPMYGTNGGFYGKSHSEETKAKMSESAKEYVKTKEHCENISKAKRGKSTKLKGYNYKIVECPHCGKTGGGGNMTRHHFNNCKEKS